MLGPDAADRQGGLSVVGVPATAAMPLDGELAPVQTVEAIAASTVRKPGYANVLVLSVTRTGCVCGSCQSPPGYIPR